MKEQILALLYHPDLSVRSQGAELAITVGEVPLTLGESGNVEAPLGVHGSLLRVLLEASAAFRGQVRTLHLALDAESRALLPRLVELPGLCALHLLGEGSLDLAPLENLPLRALTIGGAYGSAVLSGLERLAGLEALVVRGAQASTMRGLRRLRALRVLRLPYMPDPDRLPDGLTHLRFDTQPADDLVASLARFPLEELALNRLPRVLEREQFPRLRSLRTWIYGEHERWLLGWPLERIQLSGPTDAVLRALAEHPTLRHLELSLPDDDPSGARRVSFDPGLLSAMTRLEVFAPELYSPEKAPALPWPPAARCPLPWAQLAAWWGRILPEDVRARSFAGWQAAGYRWRLRILAPTGAKIPGIKTIRARWGLSLRDAKELYEAAADRGIPLLNLHTARVMQAALLSVGERAAIEPMGSAEVA